MAASRATRGQAPTSALVDSCGDLPFGSDGDDEAYVAGGVTGAKGKEATAAREAAASRSATHETDGLGEVSRQLAAFTASSVDSAVLLATKSEARQSSKRSAESVAEAQHQAMFGEIAKRASDGGSSSGSSSNESKSPLPETTQ